MRLFAYVGLLILLASFGSPASSRSAPGAVVAEHGEVTIRRDEYGVPHIYADTTFSLFYGFGYALAEDHLFQMEMLVRTARGTVAEVLGEHYLEHDRQVRGSYDSGSLQRQYDALRGDDRAIFDGYVAGYNARVREVMAAQGSLLPLEFTKAGFSPSQLTPVDVLAAYEHSMALRFSDSNSEVSNLALLSQLEELYGKDKAWRLFSQLRWDHDPLAPTTIPADSNVAAFPGGRSSGAGAPEAPGYLVKVHAPLGGAWFSRNAAQQPVEGSMPDETPHASNVWVVGPSKTLGGATVLVNGPQMGDFSPGYIWGVGLHGAGYDLVGSGPLGSPWLIFGTNGTIAWGATAGLGDTVDMYQETLDRDHPHMYLYKGRHLAMRRRIEIIQVRGGTPQKLEVYSTIHGIVDQFDEAHHVAFSRRRSWDGSEVQSLLSWIQAMRARSFQEWRTAISGVTLSINNYYADGQGNIGYTFLGKFPMRPSNQDIRLPASGTGDMEWQGYQPFESNPWVENPSQGYIANWNNKPRRDYQSSDSTYWGVVDRIKEVSERLDSAEKFSVDEIWDINRRIAFRDVNARYFIPLLARAMQSWDRKSSAYRGALILSQWNQLTVDLARGDTTPPGYTLFQQFLRELIHSVLAGKVPPSVYVAGKSSRPGDEEEAVISPSYSSMATKIVYNSLLGERAGVPQTIDLLGGKPTDQLLQEAMGAALDQLVKARGGEPEQWRDAPKEHVFGTANYSAIPDALETLELRLKLGMNRGTENNRIVFDGLGVRACDVTPPGESGFVAPDGTPSPHYKDQLSLYAEFRCKNQWLKAGDVARSTKATRELKF